MPDWFTGLINFLAAAAAFIRDRQLLNAGRAVERDKGQSATQGRIDRGRAAADADRVPDDNEYRD